MTAPNPAPVSLQYRDVPQVQNDPCSSYFIRIKRTGIIQLVGGCLLVVMGIVAIIVKAYWSYFATSIWSGTMIFSLAGVIGIVASKGNKYWVHAYLLMSIIGCLMGFTLFELHIWAAINEDQGRWAGEYYDSICQPWTYDTFIPDCTESVAARKTFDGLISCTGFFLFILSIVAASFGCCASHRGCATCCNGGGCSQCCTPTPQPVTAICQPQGPTFAPIGQQQAGVYVVQQGPAPMTHYPQVAMPRPASNTHGQATYIVMPPGSLMPAANQMLAANQAPPPSQPHTYYASSQDQVQFPPVEQLDSNRKA